MFVENLGIVDDEQRRYMLGIFRKMFAAVCCTAAAGYVVVTSGKLLQAMLNGLSFVLLLGCFGIVIVLSGRIRKIKPSTATTLLYVFAAMQGCALAPLALIYTEASIVECFATAALFFGVMCLYGYTTRRDLTNLGMILRVGLLCLIISMLINVVFMKNGFFQLAMDCIGLCIFVGLTAYDMQFIKNMYHASGTDDVARVSVYGALTLYLDFLNIFLHLLRLLGNRR